MKMQVDKIKLTKLSVDGMIKLKIRRVDEIASWQNGELMK